MLPVCFPFFSSLKGFTTPQLCFGQKANIHLVNQPSVEPGIQSTGDSRSQATTGRPCELPSHQSPSALLLPGDGLQSFVQSCVEAAEKACRLSFISPSQTLLLAQEHPPCSTFSKTVWSTSHLPFGARTATFVSSIRCLVQRISVRVFNLCSI